MTQKFARQSNRIVQKLLATPALRCIAKTSVCVVPIYLVMMRRFVEKHLTGADTKYLQIRSLGSHPRRFIMFLKNGGDDVCAREGGANTYDFAPCHSLKNFVWRGSTLYCI